MCSEIENHLNKIAKHWTMLCLEKLLHIAATASKTPLKCQKCTGYSVMLASYTQLQSSVSVGIKLTTGIPCQVSTQSAGAISACPGPANMTQHDPTLNQLSLGSDSSSDLRQLTCSVLWKQTTNRNGKASGAALMELRCQALRIPPPWISRRFLDANINDMGCFQK